MQVNTWRGNDERQWTIDWEALRNASLDNAWNICKPQLVTPRDRKSPSGTEIIFAMPVNKLRRIRDLYEDMAFRYTLYLRAGLYDPLSVQRTQPST